MAGTARRKALIVGISQYQDPTNDLPGCDLDAYAMGELLREHGDGRDNYGTVTLTSNDDAVTRSTLRTEIARLFRNVEGHDLLFYFSGHGARTEWGIDLVTYDFVPPDAYGVSLADLATLANRSEAREVVVILDCCFSGAIANDEAAFPREGLQATLLRQDVTMMAASRATELSWGDPDGGDFTKVLRAGLEGAAADIRGRISAMDLHLFAGRAFSGAWEQQPVFKSHYVFPPVLREVQPSLDPAVLAGLAALFADPDDEVVLGPEYIGARPVPPAGATLAQRAFDDLCHLQAHGLVRVDGLPDLSLAAQAGASVRLTERGQAEWELSQP